MSLLPIYSLTFTSIHIALLRSTGRGVVVGGNNRGKPHKR